MVVIGSRFVRAWEPRGPMIKRSMSTNIPRLQSMFLECKFKSQKSEPRWNKQIPDAITRRLCTIKPSCNVARNSLAANHQYPSTQGITQQLLEQPGRDVDTANSAAVLLGPTGIAEKPVSDANPGVAGGYEDL